MKKLLLLIVCSVVFRLEVYALDNVTFYQDQAAICDEENNSYRTYIMYSSEGILYFLNLSSSYNTNFEDYYEIPFEGSPYSKELSQYVIEGVQGDKFYKRAIHILLWEDLYPEKTFDSCRRIIVDTEQINAMKKLYKDVNNFPLVGQSIAFESDEVYEYYYEGLSYYELVDSEGLEVTLEDNIIKMQGDPGKYQVTFKRKYSSTIKESKLFTDGTNYLISSSSIPIDEYTFEVVIGYKDIVLEVQDETKVISDACFEINGEEYCSSEEGKVHLKLLENSLDIKLINLLEKYEEYHEILDIVENDINEILLTKKKEINIDKNKDVAIEVVPPSDEPIIEMENAEEIEEISLENTFVFPKWLIFILGGIIAKKKLF